MIYAVGLTYAVISAIFSVFLLRLALPTRDENMFLLSLMFSLVSWSGVEWALWNLGYNLFELVFEPIVPLASFFLAWTILIIYLAEVKFKRRDWVAFMGATLIISIIAHLCMDCL